MKQVFIVQATFEGFLYTCGALTSRSAAEWAAQELYADYVYDSTHIVEAWVYDDVQVWADHEL
jgi:uncharacterized protein (DUF433 family)